jgi:hypothetical protein
VVVRLASVYDSATTICERTFITYIIVTVVAPNILVADVLGLVFFIDISCRKTGNSLLSPLSLHANFKKRKLEGINLPVRWL